MKKTAIFLATALTFAACNKPETIVQTADHNTLYAQIEQEADTKTYMDGNNNIRWSSGDQVVAFMKTSLGLKYQIKDEYIGKTSGYFSQVSSGSSTDLGAGTEWDHNVVYYPYSDAVEAEKSSPNYSLSVVLPAEQIYTEESFGNGSMAMVAVSEDNNITFKNVLGGMKLQLRGSQKVVSIKLEGKNSEKLSGAATVTAYTDETKPAITMDSGASTSVTLNCGNGVQLSESTATEFIVALPPVLFSKGFTVIVTDSDSKTYTVETDKANTVLRSSLLVMPAFKLGDELGADSEIDEIILSSTSLKLYVGETAQLTATFKPEDVKEQTVVWSSDNPVVAKVDQTGLITAISAGSAIISAAANGVVSSCSVAISIPELGTVDYIDEYGINYGKGTSIAIRIDEGTAIGYVVWAPVNCGFHPTYYPYGKLYQWGRKYGQGYSSTYDDTIPAIVEGPVSLEVGQSEDNRNYFYMVEEAPFDWLSPQNDKLWNSGTEDNPIKTEYDPCPKGWRVPTRTELYELHQNRATYHSNESGLDGRWLSGAIKYSSEVPRVFLPAAGYRDADFGKSRYRGHVGEYWSSSTSTKYSAALYTSDAVYFTNIVQMTSVQFRAYGRSVRCVQE